VSGAYLAIWVVFVRLRATSAHVLLFGTDMPRALRSDIGGEIVYAAPGKLTPVSMPEWEQAEVSEFREWIFERERRLGG
jgi:hypothetical protein